MRRRSRPRADHNRNHTALVRAIVETIRRFRGCWADGSQNFAVYDEARGIWRRPGRASCSGRPDISGWIRGRALLIEVKTGTARLSWQQKAYLLRAKEHGCLAIVARSLDDVLPILGVGEPARQGEIATAGKAGETIGIPGVPEQ